MKFDQTNMVVNTTSMVNQNLVLLTSSNTLRGRSSDPVFGPLYRSSCPGDVRRLEDVSGGFLRIL